LTFFMCHKFFWGWVLGSWFRGTPRTPDAKSKTRF
jgi:hypothetical protein